MSDGSNSSSHLTLFANIGAQDILRIADSFNGFLRHRGHYSNPLHKIGIGSTKWKKTFVVISQGCVYCFKDEYAHKPKRSSFSLSLYDSVEEAEVQGALNCFEIRHSTDNSQESHMFACESDTRRQEWIQNFQNAIQYAHQQIGENLSSDSDRSMGPRCRHPPNMPLPPTPEVTGMRDVPAKPPRLHASQSSSESEDEDLDSIATNKMPKVQLTAKRPLLSLPDERHQTTSRNNTSEDEDPVQLYVEEEFNSCAKNNVDEAFKEDEYFYNSTDKQEAHKLLEKKPIGTFLVRLGNSSRTVLSVQTSFGLDSVREFRIVEQQGQQSINSKDYFPSRDALLDYYRMNVLPRKDYAVMLIKGYKSK